MRFLVNGRLGLTAAVILLLLLQGCTMVFDLLVRNLGPEPLTLRLYTREPLLAQPGYVPMAPQLLKPRRRALRQFPDSVAVQHQGNTLTVTLPPHSTALLAKWLPVFPDVDSVRMERSGYPVQALDQQALRQHCASHLGLGGGSVWLDFP